MEKTILLIDGSSFIFRAFYAIKNLAAPDGTPTNATYGVVNMLKQMQKKYTTPYWVCVFDAPGKTFRDDIYSEYKATRRATPPELVVQIPYIHDIIRKLGIPVIIESGVEADDIIATIAMKYAAQNYQILIATGDKDFAQIVNDKITLVNTMTNETLNIAGVKDKFGVYPEQIIDYLSLIGDTVDNVPGVVKCGPKTAQKWLNEYGSIANLIAHQNQLGGAVADNFRQAINWLSTAQKLITIETNTVIKQLDINVLENLTCREPNHEQLRIIFQALNFRSWLKESMDDRPSTNNPPADILFKEFSKPGLIKEALAEIIELAVPTAYLLHVEDYTNELSDLKAITISNRNFIYTFHLDGNLDSYPTARPELFTLTNEHNKDNAPVKESLNYLTAYFQSNIVKIGANVKSNLKLLARYGITPVNIGGDIIIASYIKQSQQKQTLNAILERFGDGSSVLNEEEVFGKGAKRLTWSTLDLKQRHKLIISLNHNLLAIHDQIFEQLDSQEQFLYQQIELPLTFILYQIEANGMLIDPQRFKLLSHDLHLQLKTLEERIYHNAGLVFNLNSPKQLQDILFNQLKLPVTGIKINASGGYSTDEATLAILADQGIEIGSQLLEYRSLSKLLNTYVDKLPIAADIQNRIHTTLEQTVVTSGRLSSKEPNLQNIPIKNDYGQKIRQGFIAEPGHKLVCADYSQIELRILAHISNDQNLITAFNNSNDIHIATASQIFHKPISDVTKAERRYAKSINFGLIYGKSAFSLAKELKIDRNEAKIYIDNYFAQYPKVKEFMDNIKLEAHKNGYVTTIYGRKIYLANINSSNNILRQAEERLALNAPMQGSAADIIKIAMLNVNRWLIQNKLATKMVMQVHDELILQVPEAELALVTKTLAQLMTKGINLNVPLEVDLHAADDWANAH